MGVQRIRNYSTAWDKKEEKYHFAGVAYNYNLLIKFLCAGNIPDADIIGMVGSGAPAVLSVPPVTAVGPGQNGFKGVDKIEHGPRYNDIIIGTQPERDDNRGNASP